MIQKRSRLRAALIGDRAFYAMVLAIVVPIIVQNAITNFVNLLDNIMVGRVGTNQMAGVSIANQLLFVSNLCVFGGMGGAGIFSAQFHGAHDVDGVRHCFRYKLWLSIVLTAVSLAVCGLFGERLIGLFLNDSSDPDRVASTLGFGMDYLRIMLLGIAPFVLTQAYASTLRETGDTALPMRAGIIAVFVNLVFNYLLIYDHFGWKGLGVRGAALATVLSRFVELGIVVIAVHGHREKYPFIHRAWRSLRLPLSLAKQITIKGMPLLVNEALWSLGMTTLTRCYSLKGLDVVAALNISSTISNLFSVVFFSMGNATAILLGQQLGAGRVDKARDHAWKLMGFSLMLSAGTALLVAGVAPFVPRIYNTTEVIQGLATRLTCVYALCMPLYSFCNSCYFIIRSGGKTLITFVFDSVSLWCISIPLAALLATRTSLGIVSIYFLVQLADLVKCTIGFIMVRHGGWARNMVTGAEA